MASPLQHSNNRSKDHSTGHAPRCKDLERWYPVLFELGLSLALVVMLSVAHLDIRLTTDFQIPDEVPVVVRLEDIAQTEHINRPPPPPRPLPPIQVPDEMALEDEILEIDSEIDLGETPELPPPPPPPSREDDLEPEIFVVVEEMPVLIGGLARLHELIVYPDVAARAGIEGLVVVSFVVEPDGNVSGAQILKSGHGMLDQAALDAVKQLRFIPGKQRGVPVRVRYSVPVRFRIKRINDAV